LRNREAARYARWSAIAAGIIVAVVVGMYAKREIRAARERRHAPKAVPATVQQQSAQFSMSKVEQNRTIFTIRAASATQFKEQGRALLKDVWITVYGRDGSRNDNIHTRECSYAPLTGDVQCQGDVQIDIQSAQAAASNPKNGVPQVIRVQTTNVSFNRNTGEASTPAPVTFRFPAGEGRGVGVTYSTNEGVVRIERDVKFDIAPSQQTGELPVTVDGSSLEIHRNDRTVLLHGPAVMHQGNRELTAENIVIDLDQDYHARRATAEGHPQIRAVEGKGQITISADQFSADLNMEGWIEKINADGHIVGMRQGAGSSDHFSAARVEFAMVPKRNLLDEMTATGTVSADSRQQAESHLLNTEALRVKFATGGAGATPDRQHVENVETLAPATIESKNGDETTTLSAKKFVAQVDSTGRLDKLFGHSGVEVKRQQASATPQTVSGAELVASFDKKGEWETLDERGNVQFQQADRKASAAHATFIQSTDTISLEGSPVISDSMSRTTAAAVVIDQRSGEIEARGDVVSTYIPTAKNDPMSFGSGSTHISADSLKGSVKAGNVTYSGRARLWQGESVLDADRIELWRDDKKMQATGHVVAVFPQAPGAMPLPTVPAAKTRAPATSSTKPTLWTVHAPTLTYWADQGRAHLETGVTAQSNQGWLTSKTLDVFLTPTAEEESAKVSSATPGGRQLDRILALGNVVVTQNDRRGMAEQGEYTAADGKFVLSGGQPTITDANSDTTAGHSLTFYVANDTILIDSQEGSRTLTKHRVEK
jgi:lipopolysaccharide export system protein LptA